MFLVFNMNKEPNKIQAFGERNHFYFNLFSFSIRFLLLDVQEGQTSASSILMLLGLHSLRGYRDC